MNKTDHQKHDNEEEMTPKEVPNQTANQIASSQQPTNHIEASNNGHDIDVMVTNVIKDGNGHNILKNTSPEKTTISSSTSDENIFSRIEVETRSDLIQQTVKQLVQERMEKLENNLFEGFKKELKRINEENVNLKRRERTLKGRIQLLESNLKVSTDKSTNTEECSLIQKMKIGDEKAPTNDQKESENEGDEISISPRTRIDLAEDKILPLTCSPNSSSSLRDENDITPLAPSDDNSTVIEVVETSLSREETKIELENSDELVIDEKIDIPVKDSSTEESCVEKTLSISDKPMTIERFDKGTTTKENKGTFIEVGDLKPRDEELANQNGAFFRSADQKDDRLTPRDHDIALAKPTNQGIASNESTNEIEDMLSPRISTSTSSITASVETANNNFVPAMFRSLPTMEVKPYQLTTEPERKVDQIVEKYKERNLTADRNPPVLEPSNHNRSYAEASNQNHAFIEPVSQYQPLTRAVNQQPPFSITSINPNVSMDNTPRYRMRGPSKRAANSEVFPEFQQKRKPRVGRPPLNRGPRPRHVVRPHEYQPPWYNRVPGTAAQHQRFFEEMRIRHAFELQQSPQFKRLSAKQKAKAYEEMALASMKWEQEFLKQQEHLQRLEMHRSPNGAANARFNFDPGYMQQGAPVECLHPYRNGNPRYPSEEVLISPRRKNPHARFPPEESSVSPANTNTIRQSLRIPEEELLAPQGQKQQNGNPRIPPERILVSPGERTRLIQSSPNSPSLRQQLSPRQSEQRRQDTNNNKLLQTTPDTPIVIHSPTPKQETYTTPQTRPQEKSLHSERPLSPKTKSRKLPIPVPPPLTLHEVTEGHLLTPVHDRRMSADPNMKAQQQNFKLVPVSSSKKNLAQIIRYQQKSQDNRLPTNDDLRNNKAPSRSDYDFPANQDVSRLQPVSVSKIPIPCLLDIDGRPPPTYEETQRARLPNILTELTTDVESGAVVLKWNCTELSQNCQDNVRVYLLFAYHSDNIYAQPPSDIGRWMRIGEVDALPLPIACSLTKTFDGNCYFFTVVPVDKKGVLGTMSNLCVLDVSR